MRLRLRLLALSEPHGVNPPRGYPWYDGNPSQQSMYPTDLVTNEVKNSAGTEVEFSRLSSSGRQLVFAEKGEAPAAPHRITISHQELGSGQSARRRSVVRVDKKVSSALDTTKMVTVSAYAVVDIPIGELAAYTDAKDVLAELVSMLASKGASTTILFDCSGYGSEALINGSL